MVEDGVGEVADVVDAGLVVGIGEPSSTGGSGLHYRKERERKREICC